MFDASFGVRVYPEIGSTNAEALRLGAAGERGPIWLRAERQTAGKGRSGRSWVSEPGNLYATLLVTLDCPQAMTAQLSLVTGVAVHDSIVSAAAGQAPAGLQLKWPNDVVVGGSKCAGILSEAVRNPVSGEMTVAIGIGINLKHAPEDIGRAALSLSALGIGVTAEVMLEHVDRSLRAALAAWDEGRGFDLVLDRWRRAGHAIGQELTVNAGKNVIRGRFRGLAADGALILADEGGYEHRVTFGDVAILPPGKDS
ncbi:MAG TPA: biotin--[acetyl-CoA-carboxylase] ligase [Hyphomicrobiaceae bacterium]|nr:biotin--[acetyl-CoA-carboxylase] ligase [Hyphomicrobiaceae bacterium]